MKKKITYSELQIDFLNSLNQNKLRNLSIHELGRQHFKTLRSVYLVLDKFEREKLIIVEKEKLYLNVMVTKKGLKLLKEEYGKLSPQDLNITDE